MMIRIKNSMKMPSLNFFWPMESELSKLSILDPFWGVAKIGVGRGDGRGVENAHLFLWGVIEEWST